GLAAGLADGLDDGLGVVLAGIVVNDDMAAEPPELHGRRRADAGARAGDEDALALEIIQHIGLVSLDWTAGAAALPQVAGGRFPSVRRGPPRKRRASGPAPQAACEPKSA